MTPEGKLGLIDYGQTKLWSKKTAREYATIMKHLYNDDKQAIVEFSKKMGFETKNNNEHVLYKSCVVCMDRDDRETCEGMNVQQYIEHLGKVSRIMLTL